MQNGPRGQTLEEILQNHFNAVNQNKLTGIKSSEIYSDFVTYSDLNSFENKVASYKGSIHEVIIKNKGYYQKSQMVASDKDIFNLEYGLFAGDSWVKDGNGVSNWTYGIADSMQVKIQMDIDGPLYSWKEKGYHVSFIGIRTVNGRNPYCLKLDLRNNQIAYYYIDPVTWLVYCITFYKEYSDTIRVPTYFFYDYRRVDEIKIPFKIIEKNFLMNNIITTVRIVKNIKLNKNFDESIFKRPLK